MITRGCVFSSCFWRCDDGNVGAITTLEFPGVSETELFDAPQPIKDFFSNLKPRSKEKKRKENKKGEKKVVENYINSIAISVHILFDVDDCRHFTLFLFFSIKC